MFVMLNDQSFEDDHNDSCVAPFFELNMAIVEFEIVSQK